MANRIRTWLYLHLTAVAFSVMFSLIDSHVITIPTAAAPLLGFLIFPVVAALFICPAAILIHMLRSDLNSTQRLSIVAVETTIVWAHTFALLPLVQ